MKTVWRATVLLISVALFGFAVQRIGCARVVREVQAIGVGIVVILVLNAVRLFLQTRAWSTALEQDGIHAKATELAFLRLASQGVGYITVLGPAASEPIKIKLLQHHHRSATAATLVDTGVYFVTAAFILLAGSISGAFLLAAKQTALTPLLLAGVIAALALLFVIRLESCLRPVASALGRRCPAWVTKAAQIESEMRRFASQHPAAIRHMLLLDLACQALLLCEVAITLYLLRLPVRAGSVAAIEAAGRGVRMLSGWMPARLGADEGGAAAAFAALGLPAAAGLAFALARRVRDMLNCLVGLIWLAWHTKSDKDSELVTYPIVEEAM